jgi:Nucleotidyl transferase AbiEii toxin, Type IV TA system
MHDFARRPSREQAEVFEETAARRSIGRAAIVEKDFWVCWVLSALFGRHGPSDVTVESEALTFKGGTSLSKVFGLIDRFSEDVDLTVNRKLLISEAEDPEETDISGRERERRIGHIEERCLTYVHDVMLPFLADCITDSTLGHVEIDESDRQTIWFHYPRALRVDAYGGAAYVNAAIRLEFGARGERSPAETGTVSSYAAQEFPSLFENASAPVRALSPRRTFWEKATILHAIAMKGTLGTAERQSRHYADLARLIASPVGAEALVDTGLLRDVARHKALYFKSAPARYDLAVPGSLQLIPSAGVRVALGKDYIGMREMFIAEPPSFAAIVEEIARFEALVNRAH